MLWNFQLRWFFGPLWFEKNRRIFEDIVETVTLDKIKSWIACLFSDLLRECISLF